MAGPSGKKGMVKRRFGKTGKPISVPASGRRYEDGSRRPDGAKGKASTKKHR